MQILAIDRFAWLRDTTSYTSFQALLLKYASYGRFLINSNAKKNIRVAFDCFRFGILTVSVLFLLVFFVFNFHFLRKRKLTIFHENSAKMLE